MAVFVVQVVLEYESHDSYYPVAQLDMEIEAPYETEAISLAEAKIRAFVKDTSIIDKGNVARSPSWQIKGSYEQDW